MSARLSVLVVALLTFASLHSPDISAQAAPDDLPLAGPYVVVGARTASDVAITQSVLESDNSKDLIGTELRVGDSIAWYRDRCEIRSTSSEGSPALAERNLADLQIVTASADARLNRNVIIDCLGRSAEDVWQALIVDQRVLVARRPPYATYLILEQPLAPGDIRQLKEKLSQAGFDPGSQDEQMDDSTRKAIAAFARKNGAPWLTPGIVTVNLLNALAETVRQ